MSFRSACELHAWSLFDVSERLSFERFQFTWKTENVFVNIQELKVYKGFNVIKFYENTTRFNFDSILLKNLPLT